MPLLNPVLLRYLAALTEEVDSTGAAVWDAVVPLIDERPEPLHAIYHHRCLAAVTARLAAGQRRATAFLPDVRVRYVREEELRRHDAALHSFLNVNTPEEWAQIQHLLAALL
jgi:molybdopterin-guanine dinucleotide biosynthesis protein A